MSILGARPIQIVDNLSWEKVLEDAWDFVKLSRKKRETIFFHSFQNLDGSEGWLEASYKPFNKNTFRLTISLTWDSSYQVKYFKDFAGLYDYLDSFMKNKTSGLV